MSNTPKISRDSEQPEKVQRRSGPSPGATNRGGKFTVTGRDPRAGKPSKAPSANPAYRGR